MLVSELLEELKVLDPEARVVFECELSMGKLEVDFAYPSKASFHPDQVYYSKADHGYNEEDPVVPVVVLGAS